MASGEDTSGLKPSKLLTLEDLTQLHLTEEETAKAESVWLSEKEKQEKILLTGLHDMLARALDIPIARPEQTIQILENEKLRQEEQTKKLVDENLRLQDENSKVEERYQRTKQLEKYCLLYYWLHSDCHVSLETPARTYISIHPPDTKGFHPNQLNVVQSLEEDIKRLGDPAEIIPLVGLNVHEIDEWYKTIDVHNEQWTEDYSMIETSLTKGSDDFEKYLEKHKPSNPKKKSPVYIYAAAWDHSHWRTATA